MIRVGFVVEPGGGWMGGINYYRNLVAALVSSPARRVEPVVFMPGPSPADGRADFAQVELVRHRAFVSGPAPGLAAKAARLVFGRQALQEAVLRRRGVVVHSHVVRLDGPPRLPTIAWISDFQHVRLPQFFAEADRRHRDASFAALCRFADLVIVSSEDARRDLAAFAPAALPKARVLPFAAGLVGETRATAMEALVARYAIDRPYFHLPNQFWAHKNHGVVIDALARLARKGSPPLVLATGQAEDYRAPGYFAELRDHVRQAGVAEHFRFLGVVPYADLAGLMANAAAVINPSRFEGWSTTVEEAKSLGKRLLVSDIAVHREQAPDRASYFGTDDPEALARLMEAALADYSPLAEVESGLKARGALAARFHAFAAGYEAIATEAAGVRGR